MAQTAAQKKAAAAAAARAKAMDYGFAQAFLSAHKDVAAKVASAVKNKWTPARLQAEIKTTAWWTKRTEAQRQADVMSADNPAEWKRQVSAKQAEIQAEAAAAGINVDKATAATMADFAMRNGSSQAEVQSALAMRFSLDETKPVTGTAGQTLDALHQQATDFGVTLDHTTAQRYVQNVLAGKMTPEGLNDTFREQAKILFPPIADFLDKNPGMTTKDYASPYLQIAANELGVPTDQMSLGDSKWSRVLMGGANGPMTADEWTKTLRSDQQYGWGKTVAARNQAAAMATDLQRTFGATG